MRGFFKNKTIKKEEEKQNKIFFSDSKALCKILTLYSPLPPKSTCVECAVACVYGLCGNIFAKCLVKTIYVFIP